MAREFASRARAITQAVLALALLARSVYAAPTLEACVAEVRRANDTLAQIFRQWPLHATGDPIDTALQAVASQLAARAGEQDHRHWRTHVIRDSKLNAFSIGDGHVFVTEGMLRFVQSEAELAALLAHEFAHHVAGHFCQRSKKPGLLGHLFSGSDAPAEQRQVGTLSASLDPAKEREADRIGTVILERGGYNPRAAVLLAVRMAASGTPAHFQYDQRIEAMQALLANKPSANWIANDSAAFTRMKEGLRAELGGS